MTKIQQPKRKAGEAIEKEFVAKFIVLKSGAIVNKTKLEEGILDGQACSNEAIGIAINKTMKEEIKQYTLQVGEIFTEQKAGELKEYLEQKDKDHIAVIDRLLDNLLAIRTSLEGLIKSLNKLK